MQQGKILNRFGLALIHLPMIVDTYNTNIRISDDIFGDVEAWMSLLHKAGFSKFEFSWNDLEIELCDYTSTLKYYLYTFPEPQKSSQAKYGLVMIYSDKDKRQARYFTLETSFSFNHHLSEIKNCYAICEANGQSHSYFTKFEGEPTKDNFVSVIYDKFYLHIKKSFIAAFTRKSLYSRQKLTSHHIVYHAPKIVLFSDKAYESICKETKNASSIMTGGFFLGHILDNGCWIVVEIVDSGPKTIADKDHWECDLEYVNAEANRKASMYSLRLSLLGLWIFHPNKLTYHSRESDAVVYSFANMDSHGCISGIVTIDNEIHMRIQYLEPNRYPNSYVKDSGYRDVTVEYGDDLIPEEMLTLK